MNFIVIVSDTLRRDFLGCYGNEWISTPHIDRFAAGAQVFDRAYSLSFPTVPHRRDLFTGRFLCNAEHPWSTDVNSPRGVTHVDADGFGACPHCGIVCNVGRTLDSTGEEEG